MFPLSKISDVYININGQDIPVGVCLGTDACTKECITLTEYHERRKRFELADQQTDDLVYHCVGKFVDNVTGNRVEEKWIQELINQGYDVSKLKYKVVTTNITYENVI